MPELELAPDIETKFNRLPWCHWASPSTTRHESVKSTDTDKLMSKAKTVKRFFIFGLEALKAGRRLCRFLKLEGAISTHNNDMILGLDRVSPDQRMDFRRCSMTIDQIRLKISNAIVKNASFCLNLPLGFYPLVALLLALCTTYCGFLFTENQSFVWIGQARLCT